MKKPYIKPEVHIVTRETASAQELELFKALDRIAKATAPEQN